MIAFAIASLPARFAPACFLRRAGRAAARAKPTFACSGFTSLLPLAVSAPFLAALSALLLSGFYGTVALAQAAAPLAIGQTFTIASAVLHETRRINVYLPPGYADSVATRLPVLYMPDGGVGEDFVHVAGLVQVLTGNGTMRPFMLVGIENTARRRDLTGPTTSATDQKIAPQVGGSAAFRQFLRAELMPQIQQRYHPGPETAIMGESLAGLFVLETLVLEPELFATYVAIDPSLWWNKGALVSQARARWRTYAGPTKTLYVASSRDDARIPASRRLRPALRAVANATLRWYYAPMPQETHATIYHPAALRALRVVFAPATGRPAN